MFRLEAFRQQSQTWKHQFQQLQSAGLLQRIFAWIILGLVMLLSLSLLVFVVLLSWILVPLMLYRARNQMRKASKAGYQQQKQQPGNVGNILEGEIVSRQND